MNSLTKKTKKLVDQVPTERLIIAVTFLEWLVQDEKLSQKEIIKVLHGEKEIADGDYVEWRKIARTI